MNKFVKILNNNWKLSSPELEEAPRGFVAETYKVTNLDTRYFLKIIDSRSRYADHIKLILPALAEIYEKGIKFINYPIPTINGNYYVVDGENLCVLFNYISGQSGFDYSKEEYAKRLKILHDFDVSSISASIPRENFEVNFIDELSSNIEKYKSDEALQRLLKLDLNYQSTVLDRFSELQTICQEKDFETKLTHGDAPGNVLYTNVDLSIIDWDDLMLAPIERDLWFHKGEESFFKEYGETQLDNDYFAFYLFRRYLDDLSGFLDESFKNRNNEVTVRENLKGIQEDVNGWLKPSIDEFINQSK